MNDRDTNGAQLTPEQALHYWRQVAKTLRAMLDQLPSATPDAAEFGQLAEDTKDAATAYLVAANAYIGHYTTLVSDRPHQPTPPAVAQQPQAPHGWQQPTGSHVPPSRQAVMPGYQQYPDPARSW